MSSHVEELTLRWFDEVWTKGRPEAIDEMLAGTGIAHGLAEDNHEMQGPEQFKAFHAKFKGAFPDLCIHVEEMIADGQRVAARFTGKGTHTGDNLGLPPTGRKVNFTGMTFMRWENDKIVEGWNNVDMVSILGPIGAL